MKKRFEIVDDIDSKQTIIDKNWVVSSAKPVPNKRAHVAAKHLYVKQTDKRVILAAAKKPTKHVAANEFVAKALWDAWNIGVGHQKCHLKVMLLDAMKGDEAFMSVYGKGDSKSNKFLTRAIAKAGFSDRMKTVSQAIPENWRELAIEGAARARATFIREKVEIALAADETFIRFNESGNRWLALKGSRRVGCAVHMDLKYGCTVIPTMNMLASQLLKPFVVFSGQFGATLMKKFQDYTNSRVVFTETHWIAETMCMYCSHLIECFPGKCIGLLMDYAPSHVGDIVAEVLQKLNEQEQLPTGSGARIVLEWIDKSLTSIYQPGDITVNKPLKDNIKRHHAAYLQSIAASDDFRPGQKLPVSRLKLLEMIEGAFDDINIKNLSNFSIFQTFAMCGLNPFIPDPQEAFERHLDGLSTDMAYQIMITNNQALRMENVEDEN